MKRVAVLVLTSALVISESAAQSTELVYEKLARENADGVGPIDGDVPVAIDGDGTVAFAAQNRALTEERIYLAGRDGSLAHVVVSAADDWDVRSVKLAGNTIALAAERVGAAPRLARISTTTTSGAPLVAVYEGRGRFFPFDGGVAPRSDSLSLSPNGTLAFSAFREGFGAIYRREPDGVLEALVKDRTGFYNPLYCDVSDDGAVATQAEYYDPITGRLMRGVFVVEEPGLRLTEMSTVLERTAVSVQPRFALASDGRVAFALEEPTTMTFYWPPLDPTGRSYRVTLEPGIYLAEPERFGRPARYLQIASRRDAYAEFRGIGFNASGTVVFEATLDDGSFGIFSGPKPERDRIALVGQAIDGVRVGWVRLGALNQANQVAMLVVNAATADFEVYRVSNVTSPSQSVSR